MDKRPELPQGWGEDDLSKFFADAHYNLYATFANYPDYWHYFTSLDALYIKLLSNLDNVGRVSVTPLLYRGHAAYRAALRLMLSAQAAEAYPLLRSMLEYPMYALYFRDHEPMRKVWENREKDKKGRQKARSEIKAGAIRRHIKTKDETLHKHVEHLYEKLLDFGAHPNPFGVRLGSELVQGEDKSSLQTNYLVGDEPPFHFGLFYTCSTALIALRVTCLYVPERTKILSLDKDISMLERTRQALYERYKSRYS